MIGEWVWFNSLTGMTGMMTFIWGFVIPTVLLYHGTFAVNSLTHLWGKKRFDTGDDSRNNSLVALFTFGEGWHNNHHFFQDCKARIFRGEFDLTYIGLRILSLFGLVSDLRPVPTWVKERQWTNNYSILHENCSCRFRYIRLNLWSPLGQNHNITLFESDSRPGGHVNTPLQVLLVP